MSIPAYQRAVASGYNPELAARLGINRPAGDPGLFSFLGKAAGVVGKVLPGPVGGLFTAASHVLTPKATAMRAPKPLATPVALPGTGATATFSGFEIAGHPVAGAISGGGQHTGVLGPFQFGTGIPLGPAPGTAVATVPGTSIAARPGMRIGGGYRLNKSGYWLKSGQYVAPGTRAVKIRRTNPLNPRALSRAISRYDMARNAVKRLGATFPRRPKKKKRRKR